MGVTSASSRMARRGVVILAVLPAAASFQHPAARNWRGVAWSRPSGGGSPPPPRHEHLTVSHMAVRDKRRGWTASEEGELTATIAAATSSDKHNHTVITGYQPPR